MSDWVLVLDLDGTLIGETDDFYGPIVARPHLKEFLEYCFASCAHVALWTAASREWYQRVYKEILAPIIKKKTFAFTWFGDRCTLVSNYRDDGFSMGYGARTTKRKRLRKLWRHQKFDSWGCTRHNTLIVDDTPATYLDNRGNAVRIPTFSPGATDDDYLERLTSTLKGWRARYDSSANFLLPWFNHSESIVSVIHSYSPVRSVLPIPNKTDWYN